MDQTDKFKLGILFFKIYISFINIEFIYPPLSSNIRGEATSFDSHPKS